MLANTLRERIRDVISVRPDVVEKKLFGGLGWMLQGNMAVGVMSTGGLLVRVEPEEVEAADPRAGRGHVRARRAPSR